MNHEILKDKLFVLYDGELSGEDRRLIENHLAGCADCSRTHAQWQRTAKAFFRVPQVEVSEAFVQRVMDRIKEDIKEKESPLREVPIPWTVRIRWMVPALGLACVLLLVLGVLGPAQDPVSIEALLLGNGQESAESRFVLASDSSGADRALGLIMEDLS